MVLKSINTAGGTLNINAPLTVSDSSSIHGASINAPVTTQNALMLSGDSAWQSAPVSGATSNVVAGTSKLVVQPNSMLEISGGDKSLDTNLIVQGGVRQLEGQVTVGNGAHLETTPTGRYEIVSGSLVSAEAIVNAGTFRKFSDQGSGAAEIEVDAPFHNDGGTIKVDNGRLIFTGKNTHAGGKYELGNGATLVFEDETTEITGALSASGSLSSVELSGGSYVVKNGATATFDLGGTEGLVLTDNVTVDAMGRLTNQGLVTFKSGVLTGGAVTPSNISTEGGVENAAGATLNIVSGGSHTVAGVLSNAGLIQQDIQVDLFIDGGRIVNQLGGQYILKPGGAITTTTGDGAFDNAGGLVVFDGATELLSGHIVKFNMSDNASLVVKGGVLQLGAGNHEGSGGFSVPDSILNGNADSALVFSGPHSFSGNFDLSGSGLVRIFGLWTIVSGSVTSDIHGTEGGRFDLGAASLDATNGSFVNKGDFRFGPGLITGGTKTNAGSINGFHNLGGLLNIEAPNGTLAGTLRNDDAGTVRHQRDLFLENGTILNEVGGDLRVCSGPRCHQHQSKRLSESRRHHQENIRGSVHSRRRLRDDRRQSRG